MTNPTDLDLLDLDTQLVLRAGHLPDCGEGAEFPWECTCDYAGFMERMGEVFALAASSDPAADSNDDKGGFIGARGSRFMGES